MKILRCASAGIVIITPIAARRAQCALRKKNMDTKIIEIERLPLSPERARKQWSEYRRKKHKRKTKTNMDKYCGKKLVRKCPNCKDSALVKTVDFETEPRTGTEYAKRRTFFKCLKCGAVWRSSQTIHTWQSPGYIPEKTTAKEFKAKIDRKSVGI